MCNTVSGWVGAWVCTTKTPDRNDLKLGTVVLNTESQPTRNVAMLETFKKKLKTFMFYKHLRD